MSATTPWILNAALTVVTTAAAISPAHAADRNDAAVRVDRRIVVRIPDRKLALSENDEIVSVSPVAVGAPVSPSPVGTFTVVTRVSNPTYYKPGKVVGPGAAHPIGTRWIDLS